MNKTSRILAVAMLLVANVAFAQTTKTLYVCSNTAFTLVPQTTTFTDYEWSEIGGSSNPIATTQNLSLTSPTLPGTTFSTKKYTLKVKDGAGCWSEPDTFTVHILPPINVTVNGGTGSYCANNSTSLVLDAVVGSLTLPTGVAADQYAWTINGAAAGTNNSQLTTTTGNASGSFLYNVTVSYSLPATNGGSKLNTCQATNGVTVTINSAPTTPGVNIL